MLPINGDQQKHWPPRPEGQPGGHCAKCNTWVVHLKMDHIVPIFEGGLHEITNIQWLCDDCEREKTREECRRALLGNQHTKGRVRPQEERDRISATHKAKWQ
jgi:5-methylcytosine-specific restriction endonuclease McrA